MSLLTHPQADKHGQISRRDDDYLDRSKLIVETVRLLVDHGADVNALDCSHSTPLHLASLQGVLDAVQILIKHGADVNAQDYDHRIPLFLAMQHEASNLARFLLENGADPELKNKSGKAPLHILLGIRDYGWDRRYHNAGHILVVAQLLLEHGADVNVRDNNHNTPLVLAM